MDMTYTNILWTIIVAVTINNNLFVGSQYAGPRDRSKIGRAPLILRGDQPPPFDSDFELGSYEGIHPLSDLSTYWQTRSKGPFVQRPHPCEKSSCYPHTGNLLIGREHQIYASSTCGLREPERYCIVSHLEDRKKCFWCDSRETTVPKPDLNHNISNIVYRFYPGTIQKTWWQSENGKENVYIQLDLEAEFHFTHIIITFKTFRPAAMLIERSYDFKKTWQVYRYFAHNCEASFPGVRTEEAHNLTDIVCESKYSKVAPSTDGEIIYRVLLPHVKIDNPYSHEVQTLMKVTNLRINFTKLHTLGDDLLDRRQEIQEKYYYAITDMVVRGSCSCYGHANRCLPLAGITPKVDMVHGRCECTHNTKGRNCEKCEDFFNDLPWSPAVGKNTNACKRCNCNNHATSCHFDPAVYEASGRVSGGVCDGCQHNTMGSNCEQCKSFYYRDPNRDIQDPEVCRPCDCDPHGSLDSGICDSITDAANGLIAGACHCKTNVEGRRCDTCKNGFWNFTAENPDGCESCTCNTLGTIDNQGCNVYTGECTCKRYVIGRDCNQCMDEFYGLSEKKDGCEPCDCDVGGSLDNFCDVVTGQCKCREYMSGRNCSIPKQQHFTASLDFLLYEAELSKSSPNCQIVILEPYRDGRKDTWSGLGFVKAFESSTLEFDVNNIKTTADYGLVIRKEAPSEGWDEVTITLIRMNGPPNPNGRCAGITPEDDIRQTSLPGNDRTIRIYPNYCLEEGQPYKIKMDFKRSKYDRESPAASVLIDSIVLIPSIDSIPFYHGSAPAEARRREFEMHRCSIDDYEYYQGAISEVCKQHYNSIGAFIFNGALSCQCDNTGSVSKLCDEHGGFCTCKKNVVGRRCDRCAPGTYGFGPEGCFACDCNSIGSLDNFCNRTTGQCNCRPNTYGRLCDQCRTGFWNFPNCQRCDCNGHADTCDSGTGACIECRDNTQGHTCDHCIDQYYGDPRLNIDIPCRPCPCPGIPGSGHSYAERCSLDAYTKDVICECQEGYSGARCDVCADNYYGNPEEPGGSCQPCNCSNKIDLLSPGNCDAKTGVCKNCLYDTTGDHCEHCKPGFYRNFDNDFCIECVCHILGTNSSAGPCDRNTGQCPCYPNIEGRECDECAPNHWKIASGSGCEPCDCDPIGSMDPQCNKFDGQCECKPNYGGRQCNECKANYWGNPKQNECHECTCDLHGSATMQCDRKTGACDCKVGMGGYKCDKCNKGYIGTAPNCSPCGECFDNWNRILMQQKNYTDIEIERAKNIKKVGATGAYTKEFDEMQKKLDDIERLLNQTERIDMKKIDDKSNELHKKIDSIKDGQLKELTDSLVNLTLANRMGNISVTNLQEQLALLVNKTKELENNGTLLQEANVQGALNLIEAARNKTIKAVEKAENTQDDIKYAERQCNAAEKLNQRTKEDFEKDYNNNEMTLKKLKENVDNLTSTIPELNNLVCDRYGDPCDSLCGGAGCGVCGEALTCENGAKQQANMALELSSKTEELLKQIEGKANDFIRKLVNTTSATQMAQQAYNITKDAFEKSNQSKSLVNATKNAINDFLNQNVSSTEDIEKIAEDVLKQNIELDPSQIKELAEKTKEAVKKVTNIDPIIAETKDDLKRVKKLKEDADDAKLRVQDIKNTTVSVKKTLENSTEEQKTADDKINGISRDVNKIKITLNDIEDKTSIAESQINSTENSINQLNKGLQALQLNMTKNNEATSSFSAQSQNIDKQAKETRDNLDNLNKTYEKTKKMVDEAFTNVIKAELKAKDLVNRAAQLTADISKIDDDINKLKAIPEGEIRELEDEISRLIDQMTEYNKEIQAKSDNYRSCT